MKPLSITFFLVNLSLLSGCLGGFKSNDSFSSSSLNSETSNTPVAPSEESPSNENTLLDPIIDTLPDEEDDNADDENNPGTVPGRGIADLNLFYMGHSLVGHTIPELMMQFSQSYSIPSNYNYQIGWGTGMNAHWEFYTEGTVFPGLFQGDPNFRPAHQALASEEYNVFIITESVEITSAIMYKDSQTHAGLWAQFMENQAPNTDMYLYETWPALDVNLEGDRNHPEYTTGPHNDYWLNKIEFDHTEYWTNRIFLPMQNSNQSNPIRMIPAGQVVKELVLIIEGTPGGVGGVTERQALFSDDIHLSGLGAYLVSMTQISTILDRSPCELPTTWTNNDNEVQNVPMALARVMKNTVKRVLAENSRITGVSFSAATCQ